MAEDRAIEKYIKTFVSKKNALIGESVYLDLSKQKLVSIKSEQIRDSIYLASLWVSVLEYLKNFPEQDYPKGTLYEDEKNHKTILKIDDVTMTVFLSTGTLMIQGKSVLEWFKKRFEDILRNYDAKDGSSQPAPAISAGIMPPKRPALVTQQTHNNSEEEEEEEEEVPMPGTSQLSEDSYSTQSTSKSKQNSNNNAAGASAVDQVDVLSKDIQTLTLQEEKEPLHKKLEGLRQGRVLDGINDVYPLWKELLDFWFSNQTNKVYIVTPFLDTRRLLDILSSVRKHKSSECLEGLYVREDCDKKRNISQIFKEAKKKLKSKDKVTILEKAHERVKISRRKYFHAKFMACVNKGQVEVMVTSANFHRYHFDCHNMDSVIFLTMSETEFVDRYLSAITKQVAS